MEAHDGYYLYATGPARDGLQIPVYHSKDGERWRYVSGAVVPAATPEAWNYKNFWAPEVYAWNGRYYLYYTASPGTTPANDGNRVGLAIAHSPAGPFVDHGPVIAHGSLDGSVIELPNGERYMSYALELRNGTGLGEGVIVIDRMISPAQMAGKPTVILNKHGWQEAPNIVQRGDKFFMFYAQGAWRKPEYSTRVAVASSPLGPFTELPESPVLITGPNTQGPGHGHYLRTRAGRELFYYHAWDAGMQRRSPRVAEVQWSADGVRLLPQPTAPDPYCCQLARGAVFTASYPALAR
ncbi:family 43 glycosylhydrolase [Simiduia sp. 21SJ11W-1]|uniref:family 43 glycosylhydrolase n=1 Tax=Simiduia sp. 21SJ11W-1 TaxID=2909669 RepID=UPI0020A1ED76|nr:family 43 glycosylhydrolase [Simiduia sp. 21SJ11W-1]UTA48354.1 family 43 glycosylhydrolase [Simiduia sp. 21SJ11W-1]